MSHSKFSRLNGFQGFKIDNIATFPLDSIMYEGMELAFSQEHQALYHLCTSMLVALIVELFRHESSKNVPFTQVKSLIRHVKIFLSYFNV
jgi:hypothetical protein